MKEEIISTTVENLEEINTTNITSDEVKEEYLTDKENDSQVTNNENVKPRKRKKKKEADKSSEDLIINKNEDNKINDNIEKAEISNNYTFDKLGNAIYEKDYIKITSPVSKYSDGYSILTSDRMCRHIVTSIINDHLKLNNGHCIHSKYITKV